MAIANPKLIEALRKSASDIEQGTNYEWGHMGGCNCGHLAQNLTQLSRAQIHEYAMRKGTGDWSEQVEVYCEDSGMDMDLLIAELMQHGLSQKDLINLEKLGDEKVRQKLGPERDLKKNKATDAGEYLRTWAQILEEELV